MIGVVSELNRAMLRVSLHPDAHSRTPVELDAWIDTGFEGDLLVAESVLVQHGFVRIGEWTVDLADGQARNLPAYNGWISWFGIRRAIVILASSADDVALLGTSLLASRRLLIDFPKRLVTIT
jgi:clan AA aspartic protease